MNAAKVKFKQKTYSSENNIWPVMRLTILYLAPSFVVAE